MIYNILYYYATILQDDIGQFHDVGSLDDNVDSFLSNDDVDTRDIFAALKTAEQNADLLKS